LLAEDLVRLRRPDEQRRYAACQRLGRVDPNPHQIDAVVFALRRIPEGGCILADEVGLGKTIEAGLVISQLIAEGKQRVLLIVPKSLLGQWQTELYSLFGIEAREGKLDPDAFTGAGVFLVHRELAGGLKGASLLKASDPFDLVVVDEAHEVFSALYKRYKKDGEYDENSKHAQTAGRVREVVKRGDAPVLLLTATPMQNSLAELWGLVQYVEPTGMLLGRLSTFREIFCEDGDRTVSPEQAPELRRRLQAVLQRTLRRQAQEFLQCPFVERHSRVFEYAMSEEELALYNDVTSWLMLEDLCAFRGSQRHLLLISFHRRMASSLDALAISLKRVAVRLRERLVNRGYRVSDDGTEMLRDMSADLDGSLDSEEATDDIDDVGMEAPATPAPPPESDERLRAELETVESFARRAQELGHDSKARRLLDALRVVEERGARGEGAGKAVIFTESLTTQAYLRRLLLEHGYQDADITLFSGTNDRPEAARALDQWRSEVGSAIPSAHAPSPEVAVRLALVHEFATRSKVFISTEAGAKGLNLQFCDTVINYDLPWNPQRIEQRIGRVHRYGQTRGVTVISFLAAGNEAQRLTLEILTEKLDLFGRVLDASDVVLYEPSRESSESLVASVGIDFEKELRAIYSRARSVQDVAANLQHLRDTMDDRRRAFDEVQERASGLIEARLDDGVRQVLAKYQHELPSELEGLDRDIDQVVGEFFRSIQVDHERVQEPGRVRYVVAASPVLPVGYQDGFTAIVGDARDIAEGEGLNVGHPIVRAGLEEVRRTTRLPLAVVLQQPDAFANEECLALVGKRGRIVVSRAAYRGLEAVDNLLVSGVVADAVDPLPREVVERILQLPVLRSDVIESAAESTVLDEAIAEALFDDQARMSAADHERFHQLLRQLDRYLSDQVLVRRRKRLALEEQIDQLEQKRGKALETQVVSETGSRLQRLLRDRAELDRQIEHLENGGDDEYRLWRDRLFARRFTAPQVERLLDVEFEIAGAGSW
jgi:adenine-specific DNA-methyltransferase